MAFFALDLQRFLTLERLREAQLELAALHGQRPALVIGVFFAVYVAVSALSVPGAVPMTLAAGALFGLGLGTLVVSLASTVGAVLAMWVARHLLRDAVKARFGARLAEIDRGLERDGALYLFTLRLLPVVPYFVINLAMGLTTMRTWTFAWVSQIGMLAGTAAYVNAGTQLSQIRSVQDALSPGLLGAFALLALLPWLARACLRIWRSWRSLAAWADRRPRRFDRNLIVIGAGAAGLVASSIAAALKARVTLVEAHRMGGDCLNTGCVPSKALIRAGLAAEQARQASDFGVGVDGVRVDFARVMERVRRVVREIEPHDSADRYRSLGVDVQIGQAHIVDPWHVRITDPQGRQQTLSTRAIIVATGAQPLMPPLPGLAEAGALNSETLWGLQALPRRLLVLGGGPLGCEMAQAFSRLGSQVCLVEAAPQLLPQEDEELGVFLGERFAAQGIEVLTGHRALRCERDGEGWRLIVEANAPERRRVSNGAVHESDQAPAHAPAQPGPRSIAFDRIVCAVGRQARLQGFGLEALGLVDPARPSRTLPVDEHLRTRIPTILACGDVVGPEQLTHAAAQQAWTAAVNALFGSFKLFRADTRVMPRCTFTDPEVARVGLNQRQAREQGLAFECTRLSLDRLDRAVIDTAHRPDPDLAGDRGDHAACRGWVQVLTVPGSDRILGATIVGDGAEALLAEFTLAMRHGLGLGKILGTVHAYPTVPDAARLVAAQWRRDHAPQTLLRWARRLHDWRRG